MFSLNISLPLFCTGTFWIEHSGHISFSCLFRWWNKVSSGLLQMLAYNLILFSCLYSYECEIVNIAVILIFSRNRLGWICTELLCYYLHHLFLYCFIEWVKSHCSNIQWKSWMDYHALLSVLILYHLAIWNCYRPC